MEKYDSSIILLLARLKTGVITDEENTQLRVWVMTSESNKELYERWLSDNDIHDDYLKYLSYDHNLAQQNMEERISSMTTARHQVQVKFKNKKLLSIILTSSVAAVLMIGLVFLGLQRWNNPYKQALISVYSEEIPVLYVGDRIIELDGAILMSDGNALKIVDEQGAERTIISDVGETSQPLYATLSVPRGRVYEMSLSDGSRVWLNADSRITYPLVFGPERRDVEILGEVYFEVESDIRPFSVTTRKQRVEVLGTEFNIRAYENEDKIYTTVVEGRVKVSTADNEAVLTPGMQAVSAEGYWGIANVRTGNFTGWKEGVFVLEGKPLGELMKELSRWYDFDVSYDNDKLMDITFKGSVHQYESFDRILNLLQKTEEVKFEIKGKNVYVVNY